MHCTFLVLHVLLDCLTEAGVGTETEVETESPLRLVDDSVAEKAWGPGLQRHRHCCCYAYHLSDWVERLMFEVQVGLVAAASLAAGLIEPFLGPTEVVAIAAQAGVADFGRAAVVAAGRAGLVAWGLGAVSHWLVAASGTYSPGVSGIVVAAAE